MDDVAGDQAKLAEAEELLDVLETAYEELRVAEEEVRAQQEHIAHLVEGQQLMRWQHERMLATLPVPVLTTDQYGTVRSVNAAGSWLAERRVARMVGKPIFALFTTEDRNSLRAALARQTHDKATFRINTAVVRPGGTDEAKVEAIASVSGAAQVDWMLLSPATGLPNAGPSGLPEALVELAALPFVVDGVQDVLNRGRRNRPVGARSRSRGERERRRSARPHCPGQHLPLGSGDGRGAGRRGRGTVHSSWGVPSRLPSR